MKFCSFDLEIAKELPDGERDWKRHSPLGISCAATLCSGDERPTLWFDGQYSDGAHFGPQMTPEQCQELVGYLLTLMKDGYIPLTWNGTSFDFAVLAEESGLVDECKELALNHVDMMLQFHCIKGFPVSLDAACKGMGLEGKPEGMDGSLAPKMWADGQYQEVLDYVGGDVVQPLQLAELVERRGWLTWYTKKGTAANALIPSWLTVRESLELPLPDTGWMDTPIPRERFTEWITAA